MAEYLVKNNGGRAQALKIRGGTVTIRPNREVTVSLHPSIDDAEIKRLEKLGLVFSEPGEATPKKGKSGKGKQANAVEVAQNEAKIAEAEQKLEAAKIAVTEAGTDTVALDKAEGDLKAAEAELAALKA